MWRARSSASDDGTREDACQFVCEQDADGRAVDTLDDQPFLAVNGMMTMSQSCVNLIADIPAIVGAGIDAIRLSPQSCDMVRVVQLFRAVIDGHREAGAARDELAGLIPFAAFANGFLRGTSGASYVGAGRG